MAAARALLNLTQEQLAEASGTSPSTINKFERGESISFDKLNNARVTLERKGVEFLGKDGVIRHAHGVRTYQGVLGGELFFDDLISTIREKGGAVVATFDTQETLAGALGVSDYAKLGRLEQLNKFAKVNCLLSNIHQSGAFISLFQFRAIARNPLHPFYSIIYGDKIALIAADGTDFTYVVMQSSLNAQNNLETFELEWNAAFPFVAPSNPHALLAV